jgi:3-isopropylmalate/(R)-2-methylmalate dehydratase small subunit
MEKFTQHTGIAAALLQDNIDTDAIIPSREIKSVSKHGLAEGLFAGWRYLTPGGRDANPDFILNQPGYANTSILLAGDNFGCGSSREHAVWALKEFGIRAVIAESFGGIFFNNCVANGILPITLTRSIIEAIASCPAGHQLTIDLQVGTVKTGETDYPFEVEHSSRKLLLRGLDPIGLTLLHESAIENFETRDRKQRPWAYSQA